MKYIIALSIMALLVFGCTPQEQQQVTDTITEPPAAPPAAEPTAAPPAAEPPAAPPAASVTMSSFYNLKDIDQYVYDVTTTAAGQTINSRVRTQVRLTETNGVPTYTSITNVIGAQVDVTTTAIVDRAERKCVSVSTEMTVMGQTTKQDVPCGQPGQEDLSASSAPLTKVGTETVTVPAGTFNADKYTSENGATMWVATGVYVPVKISQSSAQGSTEMVLVSYS